jgi:hypothetical protein
MRAENGLVDADLGSGLIKQRIARPGEGKSKGFRSLLIFKQGDKAFFVYGFPKSSRSNINSSEEKQFKLAATSILALTNEQIEQLKENHQLEEVIQHD